MIRCRSGFWNSVRKSQLERSGLDDAAPRLLIFRKRAELEDLTHRINQRSQGD
jgi:hypothetical protein